MATEAGTVVWSLMIFYLSGEGRSVVHSMNTGTQDGDQILNLPLGRSVLESFISASPPHEGREYEATSRNSQGMGRVNYGVCSNGELF